MAVPSQKRISITPQYLKSLERLIEEKNVGLHALFSARTDIPDGLTPSIVDHWLSGNSRTARQDHLDFTRCAYEQCEPSIQITKEMQLWLRSEIKKKKIEITTLHQTLGDDSFSLTYGKLSRLIRGGVKKLLWKEWDAIVQSLNEIEKERRQAPALET